MERRSIGSSISKSILIIYNAINMNTDIFLKGFRSKNSVNTSEGVNVSLMGKRRLLPKNDIGNVISQYDQYSEEREKCNIIRLTCQVNTVCSNVLFNEITEVIKDEGSDKPTFLNYNIVNGRDGGVDAVSNNIVGKVNKTVTFWDKEKTRDTQLTNDGFVYHCGIDIFNNHLIRSNTFKVVCTPTTPTNKFNTLEDMMRDSYGRQVTEVLCFPPSAGYPNNAKGVQLHLYTNNDLYTYKECVEKRLIETFDGWVGFKNRPKIKSYSNFGTRREKELGIERPIMYLNGGDFVDMYPDRSLYSFIPKYNKYRNRIEKNWNYCLTYPSSSYTPSSSGDEFGKILDPYNNSVKALYFTEITRADNGSRQLVIYSICKHGLKVGEYVNVYVGSNSDESNKMVLRDAEVVNVVNDYIFIVYNSDVQISSEWIEIEYEEDENGIKTLPEKIYIGGDRVYKKLEVNEKYRLYTIDLNYREIWTNKVYSVIEGKYLNIDDEAQMLSYKKTVNGIECDYYVRIFSKIPNFKYASADTSNSYELYKNNAETIAEYQKHEYDFESHLSRLAFANNAYSDEIGQVVFTDDIDISNLKDNLGRPLSSIYLTIIKNNKGYKEWYGFDVTSGEKWDVSYITKPNIEYSHCFGMITCGIETCEESYGEDGIMSINSIHNLGNERRDTYGLNVDRINGDRDKYPNDDENFNINSNEVYFELDRNYYGDLCYYDNYNAVEVSIQPIMHRFNTAQRESLKSMSDRFFKKFEYQDIGYDDYDTSDFSIIDGSRENCNEKKEGYYYNPHYEIRVKTFDKLETLMPDVLDMKSMKVIEGKYLEISTLQNHYLSIGDKAMIYNKKTNKYYNCLTINGTNDGYRTFTCRVYDESGNLDKISDFNGTSMSDCRLFKMDNLAIPSYAKILKDGTCRLIWRNVVNNGFNMSDKTVEEYPFTNGAFYINKKIDLYVRRQDPYGYWGLLDVEGIRGNDIDINVEDNYVKAEDIKC